MDNAVQLILAIDIIGFLFVWLQNLISHYNGRFHSVFMWGPVILEPFVILTSIIALFSQSEIIYYVALFIFSLMFIDGMAGLFFHLHFQLKTEGGITIKKSASGPLPFMPLIVSTLSLIGFVVILYL